MLGFESQTFLLLLISLGHFSVAKPFFSSGGTNLHKLPSLAQWSVCALAMPAPPPPAACGWLWRVLRADLHILPHPVMSSWAVASALSVYSPFSPTGDTFLSFFSYLLRMLIQGLLSFSFYILFPGGCKWQRRKASINDSVFWWPSEDILNALYKSSLRIMLQFLGFVLSTEVLKTVYLNDYTCPLLLNRRNIWNGGKLQLRSIQ